jgi:hypothetical protein
MRIICLNSPREVQVGEEPTALPRSIMTGSVPACSANEYLYGSKAIAQFLYLKLQKIDRFDMQNL